MLVKPSAAENGSGNAPEAAWDHSTHADFYDYYANASQSEGTVNRFRGILGVVLRVAEQRGIHGKLDVADIGCGAGTQARLWAELGHRVSGLDVNEPLISLARQRTSQAGLAVNFEVGSATRLPWPDQTMDVCLLPQLIEHIADWQSCVKEAARVLRPGGLLYLSTTNVLCPLQDEFDLPLYSWYPGPLKRYCERLATTTRPALANHAKYPAVHWFTFYSLRDFLEPLGFQCLDRFDLIDTRGKSKLAQSIVFVVRRAALLRFLGQMSTVSSYLIGIKSRAHDWSPLAAR